MHHLTLRASYSSLVATAAALLLIACGEDGGPMVADAADSAELRDTSTEIPDTAIGEVHAADVSDVEILYPNNLCERDDECSTNYCYGVASPQGNFEPPRCQLGCLQLNDFRRYCDSDRDCCSGRCCLDCGAKEGLCVLALPSGTSD